MNASSNCKKCTIDKNCLPTEWQPSSVMWVGLSAKATKGSMVHEPLASETNSGALIQSIETGSGSKLFHKTNLVKCAPLTEQGKTRYPSKHEMRCCYSTLVSEIEVVNPSVIFLLGKMVSDFIFTQLSIGSYTLDKKFIYNKYRMDGIYYIPIHHPSFIRIYKHKNIDAYRDSLIDTIKSLA